MSERKVNFLTQMSSNIDQVPGLRQLLLLVAMAASVALGVAAVLWSQAPDYKPLYTDLYQEDASRVVNLLQAQNIPYELDSATGNILVANEKLHQVRLMLAGQGFSNKSGVGLELINQEGNLGVSQFMEKKRYHHVMEAELSRTISSLQPVKSARVHLAMPKRSVFIRDKEQASASVLVHLHPGNELTQQQTQAIIALVASSIPTLDKADIAIIDHRGNLLFKQQDDSALTLSSHHYEYQKRIESELVSSIEALLVPIFGKNRVRAEVNTDIDFSRLKQTREEYSPKDQVVRSEQINTEPKINTTVGGIPGALSNQPPLAPVDLQKKAATTVEDINTAKYVTRNYEVGRTLSYLDQSEGTIKRLSVAVLIGNPKQSNSEKQNNDQQPIDPKQLEDLTDLIKGAVGFNAARGDQMSVLNADFLTQQADTSVIEANWWDPLSTHTIQSMIKQILAFIMILVLILTILRPAIRSLLQPLSISDLTFDDNKLPNESAVSNNPLSDDMNEQALPHQGQAEVNTIDYDKKLNSIKQSVSQDPQRATDIVQQWMMEK